MVYKQEILCNSNSNNPPKNLNAFMKQMIFCVLTNITKSTVVFQPAASRVFSVWLNNQVRLTSGKYINYQMEREDT